MINFLLSVSIKFIFITILTTLLLQAGNGNKCEGAEGGFDYLINKESNLGKTPEDIIKNMRMSSEEMQRDFPQCAQGACSVIAESNILTNMNRRDLIPATLLNPEELVGRSSIMIVTSLRRNFTVKLNDITITKRSPERLTTKRNKIQAFLFRTSAKYFSKTKLPIKGSNFIEVNKAITELNEGEISALSLKYTNEQYNGHEINILKTDNKYIFFDQNDILTIDSDKLDLTQDGAILKQFKTESDSNGLFFTLEYGKIDLDNQIYHVRVEP